MAKKKSKTKPGKRRPAPSRAVETALAGVAHDLRTPLTGILALAELLASSDLGKREREWAVAIKSGAEHLAALTTLIVDAAGDTLQADLPRWARIVLNVPSSLVAVGMMAEVSAALAQRGIPCNPVSAFLHDHVFVPWDCRHNAHEALSQLSH